MRGRSILKSLNPWKKFQPIQQGLGPKSHTRRKTGRRQADRPYKGILTVQDLYEIAATNYTISTVLDAVTADRTKEGWEWLQEDLGQNEAGQTIEPDQDQQQKRERAEKLLRNPNPQMTGKDLLKSVNYDLEVSSDSFIEVVRGNLVDANGQVIGREPRQLWPIPAGTIWICPLDETGRLPTREEGYAYVQKISGKVVAQWHEDEIIHIRANNQEARLYGRPKMLSIAALIGLQTSAMNYNLKTFTGEKIPKQIVSIDASVDDLERMLDIASEKLEDSPHNVPFVAGGKGAQVLKLMDSMRDMEFLELLRYAERSIMARWRVPPVAVGIAEANGAGIVVGRTQNAKYWDMIDEGNEQVSEELSRFFRKEYSLTAYYFHIISGKPELDEEQARVDDMKIKNNSLTINEIRAGEGLEPVDWGSQPFSPMGAQAQPALFAASLSPTAAAGSPGGSWSLHPQAPAIPLKAINSSPETQPAWSVYKAVSAARQDHGETIQVDPEAQKETEAYAARLVGLFQEMRKEMLELVQRPDIIFPKAGQISKAQGITQEQLLSEANRIAQKYATLMEEQSIEPLLEAYLNGKSGAALDLQSQVKFTSSDWEELDALRQAWANTSIVTFAQDQVKVIEDSLAQVKDAPDLTRFRNLVEDTMGKNLWREQWKLDRIARTSINRVSNRSRGVQYKAIAAEDDPMVTWITAQDGRVRTAHKLLHGQTMPLSKALAILDAAVNCRCRIVRTQNNLPRGVPTAADLVKDIKEQQKQAREDALQWYMGPPAQGVTA